MSSFVPPCRGHHREAHRCGDEAAWWQRVGMDPSASARALWLKTHALFIRPLKNNTQTAAADVSARSDPRDPTADERNRRMSAK